MTIDFLLNLYILRMKGLIDCAVACYLPRHLWAEIITVKKRFCRNCTEK